MIDTILSVLVLAAIALVIGAVAWWRRGQRKQALLMALLALVIVGNAALLLVPDANGNAPARAELK